MKKNKFIFILTFLAMQFLTDNLYSQIEMSKKDLKDKIKGGWAGQTIGVTYGGPTEFRYQGSMVNDYQKIVWADTTFLWWYKNEPGLYDDLYMDLTFVDIFEKYGLDAPVDSFANVYAKAEYPLWHANQAARYNILNGIKAPESGYWKYNPHSDCIDFQIEADFAGLMSPGMPNAANNIADKIGHIMNYGDGWYGGVFVANMYSQAFTSKNVKQIIEKALKSIPKKSSFHKCISDVINWHKKFPNDWKRTWFEVQKKWTDDISCPDGVYTSFNIDAKVNAAYIVIGLLYGNGDFGKTIDISMRCGQDSDCNPSNAAGILGTMIGYEKIPDLWKNGLKHVEDLNFKYTSVSLNKVYDISFNHALQNIVNNGGSVTDEKVKIKSSPTKEVRFEESFPKLIPIERRRLSVDSSNVNNINLSFEGSGFVVTGNIDLGYFTFDDYAAKLEITIDGGSPEIINLPRNFRTRKHEIFWKYDLPNQKHTVHIKLLNPVEGKTMKYDSLIVYSDVQ